MSKIPLGCFLNHPRNSHFLRQALVHITILKELGQDALQESWFSENNTSSAAVWLYNFEKPPQAKPQHKAF